MFTLRSRSGKQEMCDPKTRSLRELTPPWMCMKASLQFKTFYSVDVPCALDAPTLRFNPSLTKSSALLELKWSIAQQTITWNVKSLDKCRTFNRTSIQWNLRFMGWHVCASWTARFTWWLTWRGLFATVPTSWSVWTGLTSCRWSRSARNRVLSAFMDILHRAQLYLILFWFLRVFSYLREHARSSMSNVAHTHETISIMTIVVDTPSHRSGSILYGGSYPHPSHWQCIYMSAGGAYLHLRMCTAEEVTILISQPSRLWCIPQWGQRREKNYPQRPNPKS